jgi:hypothetical protein
VDREHTLKWLFPIRGPHRQDFVCGVDVSIRSIPSAVPGPVLSPPWSLQRPFVTFGHEVQTESHGRSSRCSITSLRFSRLGSAAVVTVSLSVTELTRPYHDV